MAEPPHKGRGGDRNERHGRSAAAPVLTAVPLGGQRGEARRSGCSSALPSRRGARRRLAAQRCAGAVQRRRCISRCTDRSAGGCADRHTFSTIRARVCGGLDAAEASPRRCVSWRSRGRRWRGPSPSARAPARPCRLRAVPAGSLPAAWPGVPGTPLGRAPRPPATALRQRLAAPARAAPCRCLGEPRRLGPSTRQCLRQQVVHTCWGKRCARAAELLPPVGLEHLACRGSRGRRWGKDRPE